LPPEFVGNERLRCGQDILTPMSLSAWIERDPFNKEADFPSANLIQPNDEIFLSVGHGTFEKPQKQELSEQLIAANLDFSSDTTILLTTRLKPSTTPKIQTTVDNKLDFSTSTTPKPKKKRTTATTRRPTSTIISNKLDFTETATTKRPDSPFSKLGKDVTNTTSKRSPNKKRKRPKDSPERRSDDSADSNLTFLKKYFTNSDNATKYLNNKPITSRLDDTADLKLESRSNDPEARYEVYLTTKNYDNDFDFGDRQNRPNYDYSPRPGSYFPVHSQSDTKRPIIQQNPVMYQNNRPSYQDQSLYIKRQPSRPTSTDSPISNKKQSTPFSYDSYSIPPGSISSTSSQTNYDEIAIPLYVSPNRVSNKPVYQSSYRPTYATTRKMELSTFFIVETTRRPPVTPPNIFDLRRTTQRPQLDLDYHISYSTPSSAIFISPSSISDSDLSYFISSSNTNKVSIKRPTHENPKPYNDYRPLSVFSHETYDGSQDETFNEPQDDTFDGYLRPDANFYVPTKNKHKPTYNDYSNYNIKPETSTANSVKFVYLENVLHKYYEGKSSIVNEDAEGLYDPAQTKRYAEIYDEHLTDKKSDDFFSLTRTMTDDKTDDKKTHYNSNDFDASELDDTDNDESDIYYDSDDKTVKLDGRSKNGQQQNLFLVPFKLLTKIDRPDNWVNKDTDDKNLKSRLPEVPALKQDEDVAREFPKPFFGRRKVETS
jgi:hypothetical protein